MLPLYLQLFLESGSLCPCCGGVGSRMQTLVGTGENLGFGLLVVRTVSSAHQCGSRVEEMKRGGGKKQPLTLFKVKL